MTDSSPPASLPNPAPKAGGASRWRRLGVGLPAALLAALLAAGCGHAPEKKNKGPAEVVVTTPIYGEVTDYQDFTGRLDAVKTVDVRPRVTGYVVEAPFKEGALVHKGQVLFRIDKSTYQADYNQAEANLKQAEADQRLQEANAQRGRRLLATRSVSEEEYDQMVASVAKAGATVAAMRAARDRAKLYLGYTDVICPLDGRVSRRNVDPGNLVNADTTSLTTVVTIDPMYAYFDVDERTFLVLTGAKKAAQATSFAGQKRLPVLMRLATEGDFSQAGHVDFQDNRVNGNTGTIRMRGVFTNPNEALKAGLFVRIRLPIGKPTTSLLIPDEAVQSDQGRKYVWVVDDKDEVEYRSVELGQALQGLRVIKKGLDKGERVIVEGMQRARPKMHVQVKTKEPPRAPESPWTRLLAAGTATPGNDKKGDRR